MDEGVVTSAPDTGGEGVTETTATETVTTETETADTDWKQRARHWEDRAKSNFDAVRERDQLRAQIEELQLQGATEHEKAMAQAVKEAEGRVRGETNQKLVRAGVLTAAAGRLADPQDAVRFIDLTQFEVDDNGDVDAKAVRVALDGLLKDKPYLAGKTRPSGNVDQGARSENQPQVQPGLDRIRRAFAENGT